MISKSILHPGNGYIFPLRGDYVRVNMEIINSSKQTIFSSEVCIRIDFDLNIKPEIMSLIKEMSLLEKCCLEMESKERNTKGKITYEVELLDISSVPINIKTQNK